MVRPVSPNTLAPPGQVPIPQVINHPELLKPLTPNQQAWNQQKPPSPQNPQNQLGWNSQNLPTPNMQSGSNQSPSLYQQPQFNQQNWQNQPPYNQPPNQSSYNQPPYNNNIPPYNLISNQPNFQGGNLNPQQNWGQQPTPNWGEAQNSGGLLPPGFTQVYEPIDRSRSNNKYEKKPSIPYKDSLI
jgi:hypothetical protein